MWRSALPTGVHLPEVLRDRPLRRVPAEVRFEEASEATDRLRDIGLLLPVPTHTKWFFHVDNEAVALRSAREDWKHQRVGPAGDLPGSGRQPDQAPGERGAEPVALEVPVTHEAHETAVVEGGKAGPNASECGLVERPAGRRAELEQIA